MTGPTLQPVFMSKKLGQDLKPKEIKLSIVNKQCVVYHFSCYLCNATHFPTTHDNLCCACTSQVKKGQKYGGEYWTKLSLDRVR